MQPVTEDAAAVWQPSAIAQKLRYDRNGLETVKAAVAASTMWRFVRTDFAASRAFAASWAHGAIRAQTCFRGLKQMESYQRLGPATAWTIGPRRCTEHVPARNEGPMRGSCPPGRTLISAISLSPTRRSLLAMPAAAGAFSLLPSHLAGAANADAVRPFHVNVPEADLVDLRRRVMATRWPAKETVTDQSQGVQLAKLKELIRYWGTGYDWRKVEKKLNALPMFVTEIDGLDIQFKPAGMPTASGSPGTC
jgi:hypothetical protein